MAGSLKWFLYTTDAGTQFAIKLDESNTEEVNGATGDFINTSTVIDALPRNIRPRQAFYSNSDGTRTIAITVLTPTIYSTVVTDTPTIDDPVAGQGTLSIVRIRAERIQLPFSQDTGLQDGDAT